MQSRRSEQIRRLNALWNLRELRIRSNVARLQAELVAVQQLLRTSRDQLAHDSLELANRSAVVQGRLSRGEPVRLLALEHQYRIERTAHLNVSAASLKAQAQASNQKRSQLDQFGIAQWRIVIKRRSVQDR
jgi:hypothetical protein